jgi:hypothetical protein
MRAQRLRLARLFRKVGRLGPVAIFETYLKAWLLPQRYTACCHNRVSYEWNWNQVQYLQQKLSAVADAFVVADRSPEAPETERYDEKVFLGYRWFGGISHSDSSVSC